MCQVTRPKIEFGGTVEPFCHHNWKREHVTGQVTVDCRKERCSFRTPVRMALDLMRLCSRKDQTLKNRKYEAGIVNFVFYCRGNDCSHFVMYLRRMPLREPVSCLHQIATQMSWMHTVGLFQRMQMCLYRELVLSTLLCMLRLSYTDIFWKF